MKRDPTQKRRSPIAQIGSPQIPLAILIPTAIAIIFITWIAFLPGLYNDFNFDDTTNIVENANFRGLAPTNLKWMFTTFLMGHYQPLSWLTLAIDSKLWGAEHPFGFLRTNLLMHAASAVIVYLLAIRLIRAAIPNYDARRIAALSLAAAAAALLFAIHPMRVESVSWTTERRDVQSSLLLLLSLLAYLRAQERAALTVQPAKLLWSILLFALSLLSRAMGVTFPVILLLIDTFPLRRFQSATTSPARRAIFIEKIPYFLMAFAAAIVAPIAQSRSGAATSFTEHGFLQRLAQASYGLCFYLWKSVWPTNLSAIYELHIPLNPLQPRYILSAVAVILIAVFLITQRKRHPGVAVALLAYAILLSPVLGFFQSGRQEVADRYSYLPSICIAICVAASLFHLYTHASAAVRTATYAIILAALFALTALTRSQTQVWKSPLTLWAHAASTGRPSALAHYNYGCELNQIGNRADAVSQFQQSIAIDDDYSEPHFNLGNALKDAGRTDDALLEYNKALHTRHEYTRTYFKTKSWFQIAQIYSDRKDYAAAEKAYRQVIAIDDAHTEARHALANMLAAAGRTADSLKEFAELTTRWPDIAEAHYDYGLQLANANRLADAANEYRRAIALRSDFADAYSNLADILVRQGNPQAALAELKKVLAFAPAHHEALFNQATALARLHRPEEAIVAYQILLRAHPHETMAHFNLAVLLAQTNRADEAIAEFETVLRLDPNNQPARQNLDALLKQRSQKQ